MDLALIAWRAWFVEQALGSHFVNGSVVCRAAINCGITALPHVLAVPTQQSSCVLATQKGEAEEGMNV